MLILLSCCASAPQAPGAYDFALGNDEGIVVFRVHNANAGMAGWYNTRQFGGQESRRYLALHSDIRIARRGALFYSRFYTVPNEQPEQVVCMVIPQGTYRVDKIGRNTDFYADGGDYVFTVSAGMVNYVGDFYLSLYLGTPSTDVFPITSAVAKGLDTALYDWYALGVEDQYAQSMDEALELFPAVASYQQRNGASPLAAKKPSGCWGERAECVAGENGTVHLQDGVWIFPLAP